MLDIILEPSNCHIYNQIFVCNSILVQYRLGFVGGVHLLRDCEAACCQPKPVAIASNFTIIAKNLRYIALCSSTDLVQLTHNLELQGLESYVL